MNNYLVLLEGENAGGLGLLPIVIYIVFFGVLIYFLMIRPQKKQQKQQDALMSSLEIGDSVLTTAGMYGVIIDKVDENVVIIEFGNNKNCRIPMRKTAIVEIEKPDNGSAAIEEKDSKKAIGKKDKSVKD